MAIYSSDHAQYVGDFGGGSTEVLNNNHGSVASITEAVAASIENGIEVEHQFDSGIKAIAIARQIFKDAFEEDEGFREAYSANIAMLLHDRYGITDHRTRNKAAIEIMEVIFEAKEIKPVAQDRKDMIDNRWEILDL